MDEVVSLIPKFDKNRTEYYLSKNGENFYDADPSSFFLPAGIYSQLGAKQSGELLEVPLLSFPCLDHNKIVC